MKANVSGKGYTNVLLVLNMKRFVHEQDRARFERLRGRDEFAHSLREIWPRKLAQQDVFITIEEDKRRRERPDVMNAEQVGFATGVFRSLMLEKYTFPAYALDREKVRFSDELTTNSQFKTLFLRIWDRWSVYVRPTNTGFFVIRLTNRFRDQSRSFIKLAQDVQRLQESLDIRSALNWLRDAREKYLNDPETLAVKERSVRAFLEWLGVDENYEGDVLAYPVQWRLAMEVCSRFGEAVGSEIYVDGEEAPIRLQVPNPSISIPLHDSYVIHNFSELLVDTDGVNRLQPKRTKKSQKLVELADIQKSSQIRQSIVNLAEGIVLKTKSGFDPAESGNETNSLFPTHRRWIVNEILNHDQAVWKDEIFLMDSGVAIILPSSKWRDHEILVSSTPSSKRGVKYHQYWAAMERMIEFVLEIRVFAQLIEFASYDILAEISERIYQTRSQLFSGDIIIDERLPELVARAASLRHQGALCASMSLPESWSRVDFAIRKADYLLEQMRVQKRLELIERNIDNISEFVNHIDDLYMADLSEQGIENDKKANWLSMVLASASLTLTILILPSFWADMHQLENSQYKTLLHLIETAGNWLAIFLVGSAIVLFIAALIQRLRLRRY